MAQAPELRPLRIRAATSASTPTSMTPAVSTPVSVPSSPATNGLDTPDDSDPSPTRTARATANAVVADPTPSTGRGVKRPRREEAALFLEKTYELLERCPRELASWTARGESFVVKQPSAFAERVIPTYFKHRKFSSFVRQLNLYGFRKVRAAALSSDQESEREREAGTGDDSAKAGETSPKDWWEFRHERFVRGRRDLLCEIRRRSSGSDVRGGSATGSGSPVERAEFEELRTEVGGLRDEIQKLQRVNQQLASVLQAALQRSESNRDHRMKQELASAPTFADSPRASQPQPQPLPSISAPSPSPSATTNSTLNGPQLALLQLRQGVHQRSTPTSLDQRTPRSPAPGSFLLRSVHSLLANGPTPSPRPMNSPSPGYMSHSLSSSRNAYHQQSEQFSWHQQSQQQRWYQTSPAAPSQPSPLKRLRVEAPATAGSPSPVACGLRSPEDEAVRQLSRMAAEIRQDLLACITARVTGFLRVHREQQSPTREADADAVADVVGSDIRQKLALLHSSSTSASPSPHVMLDSQTTCMYRVEILKFISRELPRAVQDAVDRRLPAPEKLKQRPAKDRSLLALLVQKAQKALEHQMHSETASSRH